MRRFFENLFKKKGFYIVFSIIMSVVLWTYVEHTDDPTKDVYVPDIPVVFTGADTLKKNDLTILSVDTKAVSIRFSGSRNVVTKLNSSNVSLTVNLNEIVSSSNEKGEYQLQYSINYPSDLDTSSVSADYATAKYITVTVDNLVSKDVPISGNQNVTVADGYQAEQMKFEPASITVTGPESIVSQVSYAWVTINKANLSKTIQEQMPYVLMDSDGDEIDSSLLTMNMDTVLVTIPVVVVKEVALTVNLVDSASVTADEVTITVSPATVMLTGDAETLKTINQIVLGTIDLSDFALSTTETFPVVIPNDVVNVSGETTATVTVKVNGLATSKLSITNIQVKNETAGYTTTIVTQSLDVTLRGQDATLSQIKAENIRAVVDLSELGNTTGTYSVTATIYIDGYTSVDAIGEYKVTVTIAASSS